MEAIKLIEEAVDSGAQLSNACKALGITDRTYYRWKNLDKSYRSYEDRRTYADHSDPANKLSPEERQRVLDIVNEERNRPVKNNATMDELLLEVMDQNFVPVIDDRNTFIGIVTRKAVIQYFYNKEKG